METNSVVSHVMLRSKQPEPDVGMGATICLYTDRHACTIVEIKKFKTGKRAGQIRSVFVQQDIAKRTDKNGPYTESQDYEYSRNTSAPVEEFKADKHGNFKRLIIGRREEYYDPSF